MEKTTSLLFRLCMIAFFALTACQTSSSNSPDKATQDAASEKVTVKNIDVPTFRNMMAAENTIILDVRTPPETQMGMIDGATAIDINGAGFKEKISQLDKDKTYLVYCQAGSRSSRACDMMAEMGFKNLFNLEGGYMAWEQE